MFWVLRKNSIGAKVRENRKMSKQRNFFVKILEAGKNTDTMEDSKNSISSEHG